MTSLLNLLLASFLATGAADPAPAAARQEAPQPGKDAEAAGRAVYKEMLDATQKINEICTHDNFGKACIKAQEDFQRKFLARVPANHGNGLPFIPGQAPKPAR